MSKKITAGLAALSLALFLHIPCYAADAPATEPVVTQNTVSDAVQAPIKPAVIETGSFAGATVNISLPLIDDSHLQYMQDFFSANIARSLYAYLPYASSEYGRPNPLCLKESYTLADISNIAKVSDFIHKRRNAEAEARQEYSNRYQMFADYEVKLNNSDYLSILQSIYTYSGGAHGLTVRYSMTADRATGRAVKLADIFADKTYLNTLNALAANQNQEITLFDKVRLTGSEDFYLTDKGLTVYFQLYEVAPYAAGFVEYFFPYEAIALLMAKKHI